VRPAHGPGEFVSVLLDSQGGGPLLPADLIFALPRPDRVCLAVCRAGQTADAENQRHREDRLHKRLHEKGRTRSGPTWTVTPAADSDSMDADLQFWGRSKLWCRCSCRDTTSLRPSARLRPRTAKVSLRQKGQMPLRPGLMATPKFDSRC